MAGPWTVARERQDVGTDPRATLSRVGTRPSRALFTRLPGLRPPRPIRLPDGARPPSRPVDSPVAGHASAPAEGPPWTGSRPGTASPRKRSLQDSVGRRAPCPDGRGGGGAGLGHRPASRSVGSPAARRRRGRPRDRWSSRRRSRSPDCPDASARSVSPEQARSSQNSGSGSGTSAQGLLPTPGRQPKPGTCLTGRPGTSPQRGPRACTASRATSTHLPASRHGSCTWDWMRRPLSARRLIPSDG